MPVDQDGNRADIVMDPNSKINRMNIGGCYEQYYNSVSRDIAKKVRTSFGIELNDKKYYSKLIAVKENDPALFSNMFRYLLGYYKIVSPEMYKLYSEMDEEGQFTHLDGVMQSIIEDGKDKLYLYQPTDNEVELIDTVKEIEKHYKPVYGPVSYIGNSGKLVPTVNNVRVGSMYFMLLEKIGDTWSALSSGRLQHFGVLSKLNKTDRNFQPTRTNPVRGAGEAETRIIISYVGKKAIAEIFDRNNNPTTHKEIVKNILTAENPFEIDKLLNRDKMPYGGAKPLQLTNHLSVTMGWRFKYTKEVAA